MPADMKEVLNHACAVSDLYALLGKKDNFLYISIV